ncbi:hypothetical protein H012_gp854 [Acanthamoeba polyphaga moumouvirus]|uniref:Uncharacterized protein n=2 Tax=Moumouvirus TaxID=3080801 RepID=L7RBQ4_9VIRU|nr:hypothetical protein H012_gp854 [Acanthamoeba polyphaga moumouvirus]AEX63256.1 hypothetical protein mv_R1054 [Moumouvirus Monve]AGC01612.1 hypothetical protein Moumou_00064 [Acanthamoeba polyphaga moumouvirus]AQN67937.1 hypothetical protein [Saudi moumouvirus]
MQKYQKLEPDPKVNIFINSDDYIMTKHFDIHILYDKNTDKIPERKFYDKHHISMNEKNIVTKIPSGSLIHCLEIETGSFKYCRYMFSIFSKIQELNIKFENGKKYPIVSINGKYANLRERCSSCVLM